MMIRRLSRITAYSARSIPEHLLYPNPRHSFLPNVGAGFRQVRNITDSARRLNQAKYSLIDDYDAYFNDGAYNNLRNNREGIGFAPHSPAVRSSEISCTVIDKNGKVVAISKKIPRSIFLTSNGLHPRDLRNLSHAKVSIIPSILVRDMCILVNMLDLQVVIKRDQVLILDNADQKMDTTKLSLFIYDLESKLNNSKLENDNKHGKSLLQGDVSLSYEMKALESVLMNTISRLEVEFKSELSVANTLLNDLEDNVDRDLLRELLMRSRAMAQFYQKSLLIRDVISDVLENDEDLVSMYLTEKHAGIERDDTDHAEVELLLESYYKQTDEIVQQAESVKKNIKTTEEIINIMLDSNRNSLMLMELKITIGTLGFTIGMFFAALYGMNLENFIEETNYGFGSITAGIAAISILLTWYNFRILSAVKKVTMMGVGPRK
jgi:magnesium transporter